MFSLRLATLGLLYFVQGAPYGFQTACLPIVLREVGLSFTALGAMKLLFLPWVCKPIYAPIIERTKTKDWWLTVSMSLLGLTCLLASAFSSPQEVAKVSALMLALNLFSAAQDVATDSLAVKVLAPDELGMGNTIQVVAYKAGSVFAGGLLLWLRDFAGWGWMFAAFAAIYGVAVALFRHYRLADRSTSELPHRPLKEEDPSSFSFSSLFLVPGTLPLLLLVSMYKLCERAEQTFTLFLVDKGAPSSTVAMWSTVVRSASLLGSAHAGRLLSSSPSNEADSVGARSRRLLLRYCTMRAIPIAAQAGLVAAWGTERSPPGSFDSPFSSPSSDAILLHLGFLCTGAALFCAGAATTAAFTLMMGLSQRAKEGMQGTHYTLLATFEVLGKLSFASVSGWAVDQWGIRAAFAGFSFLALATVPAVAALANEDVTTGEEGKGAEDKNC